MNAKDQLSKVRVFQTELSMLLTRFREFRESRGARFSYLPEVCRDLGRAQEWLRHESERLRERLQDK